MWFPNFNDDPEQRTWLKTPGVKEDKQIQKGETPPGPPPRPGLKWKPSTSRWIRPIDYSGKIDTYLKQERLRKEFPALSFAAPRSTEMLIKYLVEEIPENAHVFGGMIRWLEGYSKLAIDPTNTSDEEVDKVFKQASKRANFTTFEIKKRFNTAINDPSRLNKVLAIDAFAHFIHDRGSTLPQIFGAIALKTPKGQTEWIYRDHVWTNLDDIVLGILEELATRANMPDDTQKAKEGLQRYIEQTRDSTYGKQELNDWVNRAEPGEDMLFDWESIRKETESAPDPYSVEYYDWVEKQLEIGGKQIKGVKQTGVEMEKDLYYSLKKACNEFLDSLSPATPQHEVIHGLGDVVERWTKEQHLAMSEAFDKLYKAGFYAGVVNTGVRPAMRLADELVLRLLKTDPNRIGARIKLFGQDIVKQFNRIVSESYTAEGEFWMHGMVQKMREVVPAQRYQLERIVRTEVAAVSNAGRLLGWSEDPLKYFYDYHWQNAYDNRTKYISLWRGNQNPLTFDEAKFLWEHQAQTFNGKLMNDTFNQRCSLSRAPIDDERKGNRWSGDHSFIQTMQLGF